jgi:4'-phosphopantetheinyl transferase EntD
MQAWYPTTVKPSPLLACLFSEVVIAVQACESVGAESLHPDEAQYVARAVPKRVAEFAAGRACARVALEQLGVASFTLHVGADREPLWPAGITGSITHTAGFCGVVAAQQQRIASLGIDAEVQRAVRAELRRAICTPAEEEQLQQLSPARAADLATVVFSAKEAFFKCQFPLTHQWLNFHDVSVQYDDPTRAFAEAHCAAGLRILPHRPLEIEQWSPPPWTGRFACDPQLVATGFALAPSARR